MVIASYFLASFHFLRSSLVRSLKHTTERLLSGLSRPYFCALVIRIGEQRSMRILRFDHSLGQWEWKSKGPGPLGD